MSKKFLRYLYRHQATQLIALGCIAALLVSVAPSCSYGPTVLHNPQVATEENLSLIHI